MSNLILKYMDIRKKTYVDMSKVLPQFFTVKLTKRHIDHPELLTKDYLDQIANYLEIPEGEVEDFYKKNIKKHENIFLDAKNKSIYSYTDLALMLESSRQRVSDCINHPDRMGESFMYKVAEVLNMDDYEARKYWICCKIQKKYNIYIKF